MLDVIGGLVAAKIDPQIMGRLAAGKRTAIVTGTNGKSTTTRMTAAAMAELGEVATQADGANMDAGIIATLTLSRTAPFCALEVDELHVPHVSDAVDRDLEVVFPVAALLIGLILGPMAEQQLRRALQISQGDPMVFLQHPGSAVMIGLRNAIVRS